MRRRKLLKIIYILICVIVLYLLVKEYIKSENTVIQTIRYKARPYSLYQCPSNVTSFHTPIRNYAYNTKYSNETTLRVLLISGIDSKYNRVISDFIHYLKLPVRIEVLDNHELLLELITGRFSIIVFENHHLYLKLSDKDKDKLHRYCIKFKVGIISFFYDTTDAKEFTSNTGIEIKFNEQVTEIEFNKNSRIPFVGKKNVKLPITNEYENGWTVFAINNESSWKSYITCTDYNEEKVSIAVHNHGDVEHVIFGNNLDHFIFKIAFWDVLLYMSRGSVEWSLDTYIEIDIDDVFVGQIGTRLAPDDIYSLIKSQDFLRQYIDGFNYTLGFSGHLFKKGQLIENDADELLICKFLIMVP